MLDYICQEMPTTVKILPPEVAVVYRPYSNRYVVVILAETVESMAPSERANKSNDCLRRKLEYFLTLRLKSMPCMSQKYLSKLMGRFGL